MQITESLPNHTLYVKRYYVSRDGQTTEGPFDIATLRRMRSKGELTAQAQVCAEGTQIWQPIKTVIRSQAPAVFVAIGVFVVAALIAFGLKFFQMESEVSLRIPDDILTDLQRIQSEFIQDAKAQVQAHGYYSSDTEALKRRLAPLEAKIEHLPKRQQSVVKAMLSFLEKIISEAAVYQAKEKELENKNVLRDPASIKSRQNLEAFRRLVGEFREANRSLSGIVQTAESDLRADLTAVHVPANQVEIGVGAMRKSMHLDQLIPIRQLDDKIAELLDRAAEFLEKSWGSWQVDRGQIRFHTQALLDEYKSITDALQSAASEQGELQRKLLDQYH